MFKCICNNIYKIDICKEIVCIDLWYKFNFLEEFWLSSIEIEDIDRGYKVKVVFIDFKLKK